MVTRRRTPTTHRVREVRCRSCFYCNEETSHIGKIQVLKMSIFQPGDLDLFQFLLELKTRLLIEKLCSLAEGSFSKRFRKWNLFYHNL